MTEIRKILPSEKDQYLSVITMSFSADPVSRYMYPSPERYMKEMPIFTELHGGNSVEAGTAWTIDNFVGASGWVAHGNHFDEEALVDHIEKSCYPDHLDVMMSFFEELGNYIPEEPHWYLPMIGLDPRYFGQGLGTKLLNHALDIIDEKSEIAFLTSSNPRNIPAYERCGFEVMGKIDIGGETTATPMIRKAR